MNLNRKVVEGSIVTGMLMVMTATTSVTNQVVPNVSTNTVSNAVAMAENENPAVTAGVMEQIRHNEEASAMASEVNIEQSGAQVVASADAGVVDVNAAEMAQEELSQENVVETVPTDAGETPEAPIADVEAPAAEVETAEQTDEQSATLVQSMIDAADVQIQTDAAVSNVSSETEVTENVANAVLTDEASAAAAQEEAEWANRVMPSVDEYLNVRAAGDENAEIVGKLYKGDAAEVVERGDTWTHITSGSVDGYVLNDYCTFGTDAYALAQQDCQTEATVLTGGLRLRQEPSEEASVIDAAYEGQTLTVNTEVPGTQGWVAVEYNDQTVYVSADYVDVDLSVGKAISIEEERAAAAAEAEKQSQNAVVTTQKEAVAASADDVTILGALIQLEAGSECYEGKVAVGAVVMNRVRSGSYPNSISGVIYQGGQFTTASSINAVISGGVNSSCMQAAQEAINGADNTGGCVSFRRASSGYAGVVIGNHVFF